MKTVKRTVWLIMVINCLVCLVGCGGDSNEEEVAEKKKSQLSLSFYEIYTMPNDVKEVDIQGGEYPYKEASSDNEKVAIAFLKDHSIIITAVGEGTANIWVVDGGGYYETLKITVTAPVAETKFSVVHVTDVSTNLGLIVTNVDSSDKRANRRSFSEFPSDIRHAAEIRCLEKGANDPYLLENCIMNEDCLIRKEASRACRDAGVDNNPLLGKCIIEKAAESICKESGATGSAFSDCKRGIESAENQETDEVLLLFGNKNRHGRLIDITKMMLASQSTPCMNVEMNFGVFEGGYYLPESIETSDGTVIEIEEYGNNTVSVKKMTENGDIAFDEITISDSEKFETAKEILRESVNSLQQDFDDFDNDDRDSCIEMMENFLAATDNFIWAVSQISSEISCAMGSAGACFSVILNGLDKIADIATGGNSPFKEINALNNAAGTVSACAKGDSVGCLTGMYGILRDSGALTPETFCPDEPSITLSCSPCTIPFGGKGSITAKYYAPKGNAKSVVMRGYTNGIGVDVKILSDDQSYSGSVSFNVTNSDLYNGCHSYAHSFFATLHDGTKPLQILGSTKQIAMSEYIDVTTDGDPNREPIDIFYGAPCVVFSD